MKLIATILELVGALLACVSVACGNGVAVVTSPWLGGLIGGVFLIFYAAALER